MVNHGGCWDIKRENGWKTTIGTEYPGSDAYVLYHGEVMRMDELGNYTYGIIGRSFGIGVNELILGSYYAAGCPEMGIDLWEEESDWPYIIAGYQSG